MITRLSDIGRPKKKRWTLIENAAQTTYKFRSLKDLRAFAAKYNLAVKKSPTSDRCYYTEGA